MGDIAEVPTSHSRGVFVLFEGCDRCGKTTQSQLLVETLRKSNKPVRYYKFPDAHGPSGQTIREYLAGERDDKDVDIQKLFCQQRHALLAEMREAVVDGFNLVVDRYSFSGVVYSHAQSSNFEECKTQENGLLEPDIVFLVDCDPEEAALRVCYGSDRYEKVSVQRRVRDAFLKLKAFFDTTRPLGWWCLLDASAKPVETLRQEVWETVRQLIENNEFETCIRYLNFDDVHLSAPVHARS